MLTLCERLTEAAGDDATKTLCLPVRSAMGEDQVTLLLVREGMPVENPI